MPAQAQTYAQIQSQFLNGCPFADCVVVDSELNPHITYTAGDGQRHVVWYESPESAAYKINLAREFGVGSVGFWAYGYYE